MHVIFDEEVGIVCQEGVPQPERNLEQTLTEGR